MLKKENILIIGFPAWDGDYTKSTVKLASELAKTNNVLYVEYPFTWSDVFKKNSPSSRILGLEKRLRTLPLPDGKSINVLTLPPMMPVNFIRNHDTYDLVMRQNAQKAHRCIQQNLDFLGMKNPVVINAFNPFLGVFLARRFQEKALIYYCYDEISAATWVQKHGTRLEKHFLRQADAVITSSATLLETKKRHNRHTYLVRNGADFELFHHAYSEAKKESQSVRIGYIGSIDERLDYDLLEAVIAAKPTWTFQFTGRITHLEGQKRLSAFSNVVFTGSKAPGQLPDEIATFHACIIPFVKNELTSGIYPMKINEYFAAGKPVVTTDFGDMEEFRHLVFMADDAAEFISALEDAVSNKDDDAKNKRIKLARANSWQNRGIAMGNAIEYVIKHVAMENTAKMDENLPTWMPDNYNRWGRGGAAAFSRPTAGASQPAFSSRVSVTFA